MSAACHGSLADRAVGLECQEAWCNLILSGQKLEETRRYALPSELLGRKIWLLASSGRPGIPALAPSLPNNTQAAHIVGWVVFSEVRHYTDKAAWVGAFARHLVPDEKGPYGWLEGDVTGIYGWVISDKELLPQSLSMVAATRLKRSLYVLKCTDAMMLAKVES